MLHAFLKTTSQDSQLLTLWLHVFLQANSWQDTTNPPSVTSPQGPPGSVHSDTSNWSGGSSSSGSAPPTPILSLHFFFFLSSPSTPCYLSSLHEWGGPRGLHSLLHKHKLCWNTGTAEHLVGGAERFTFCLRHSHSTIVSTQIKGTALTGDSANLKTTTKRTF